MSLSKDVCLNILQFSDIQEIGKFIMVLQRLCGKELIFDKRNAKRLLKKILISNNLDYLPTDFVMKNLNTHLFLDRSTTLYGYSGLFERLIFVDFYSDFVSFRITNMCYCARGNSIEKFFSFDNYFDDKFDKKNVVSISNRCHLCFKIILRNPNESLGYFLKKAQFQLPKMKNKKKRKRN